MKSLCINTCSIILLIFFLSISCSNNSNETELIPFRTEEGFQFATKKGDTLKNQNWNKVDLFTDKLARVQSKKKPYRWGFINDKGDTVLKPVYRAATKFNEGIAFVVQSSSPPMALNNDGEKLFDLPFAEHVDNFHEGLAPFSVGSNDQDDFIWGFVNKKGEIEIQPQFFNVYHFAEGLCPVQSEDDNWGYINKKGELVIDYQFDEAFPFVDETAVVALGNFYGVIDTRGNYIINPQFDEIQPDGDLFLVLQDDKYGWIDKKGSVIINPQFKYAFGFNGSELAPVLIRGISEWGYINSDGILAIKPRYSYALPFDGRTALIRNEMNFEFINDKGESVVETEFMDLSETYIEHWKTDAWFNPGQYRVETAYFNYDDLLDTIKSVIMASSYNSIYFGDTLGVILDKFNIVPDRLPKGGGVREYPLKEYYTTNDARVAFSMKIRAFNENKVERRYNSYTHYDTEYVLNESVKPEGFTFVFSLNERGMGKASKITNDIFEIMKDYELIEEDRYGYKTFRNGENLYRVGKYYSNGIKIEISKS